jgi:phospholipid/cholesterol/gamma-HCH transport system substrate-binding protein
MNEQALRFRIGVFVLASLLLLAVLITLFGSFPRVLTRTTEYTVRFTEAPGVAEGTPVRRSGIRVGEVRRVELDDETGAVRVHIAVEKPHTIRQNEQPTLVQGILGGDTAIDFLAPRDGEKPPDRGPPVEPGAELEGVREATVNTLLNQASDVVPTTQEALNDIRKSVQRFEKMAPLMEEAVKEHRDAAKAIREMTPELRKTNDEVRELAKATRETTPEVRRAATEVADLAKATRETIPELRKTNEEAQVTLRTWDRLGERLRLLVAANEDKIGKALDNLNETLTRVSGVFTEENQRNITETLRNVRAGSQNLDSIGKNTDALVKDARVTLKRFDEVLTDLQAATKPLGERGGSIMKNLDEGSGRFNAVMADVQALLRVLDKGDGTVQRLLTDPSLFNRLDEAACQINKILPRIDRILKDVEVFADKIARHPESLGVGGAVRPSSGLKESPSLPHAPVTRPGGP